MAMAHSGGASSSGVKQQVKLEKESELWIEVGNDAPLCLRLLNVFTWYGAIIEMEGTTEIDYTTNRTPVVSYVNVHAILETRRTRAKASSPGDSESSQGPRVIVVGPTNSGKSTLSRMLLSWVAKQGSKPTFDMRIQLQFTLFGFDSNNVEFYKVLVKKLGGMLERQFTGNTKSRASGMVMNTMGRIEGVGYDVINLRT
ncbi:hypothetical protein HN51_041209 [Arachis hypogaea]